uniref:RNase H type-1 domain-containing protein n=1 Tax=Fagus sylvatica TaxID=28930 RepID=A0A2N9J703_FAGSY
MKSHCFLTQALTKPWNLRNKLLHENETPKLIIVICGLDQRVHEFKELVSLYSKDDSLREPVVWRPPPTGFIKLNVDPVVLQSRTTLAAVARNDKGEILKIWAKVECSEDLGVTETKTVLWALQMAIEKDYHHVLMEGDAKSVIDALQKPSSHVD